MSMIMFLIARNMISVGYMRMVDVVIMASIFMRFWSNRVTMGVMSRECLRKEIRLSH